MFYVCQKKIFHYSVGWEHGRITHKELDWFLHLLKAPAALYFNGLSLLYFGLAF